MKNGFKTLGYFSCITIIFFISFPLISSDWIIYNKDNSDLRDNIINNIAIDSLGNKWLATAISDVIKFKDTTWIRYQGNDSTVGLSSKYAVAVDSNNNIWIGTVWWGIIKVSDTTWSINFLSEFNIDSSNGVNIYDIKIDKFNNLWACSNYGLLKYDGNSWTQYDTSNSGIPDNVVTTISFDSNNNKWIGTYEGLVKFDGTNWTIYNTQNSLLPKNYVEEIAIDKFNNKWIGIMEGGLAKFDDSTWVIYTPQNSALPCDLIGSIAIDTNNVKWIGTCDGLVKLDDNGMTVYKKDSSSLPGKDVYGILVDKFNNKWICTEEGLAVFNENGITSNKAFMPDEQNFGSGFPHPNPAGNITNINYTIPTNGNVKLSIYDADGKEVKVLENGFSEAGSKDVQIDTSSLSAGTYYVTMTQNGKKTVSKVIVVK